MTKSMVAAAALLSASAFAYNSLAPHTNTENTDFWDTTRYTVTPASSASGVCSTVVNRLVRTVSTSQNVVSPLRRVPRTGFSMIVF